MVKILRKIGGNVYALIKTFDVKRKAKAYAKRVRKTINAVVIDLSNKTGKLYGVFVRDKKKKRRR